MVLNLDEEKLARENEQDDSRLSRSKAGRLKAVSRLNFLRVTIVGGFSILGWRLWDLQVNKPPEERQQARKVLVRDIMVKAPRGIIYDRNKKPLVSNVATYAVTITRANLPPREDNAKSSKTPTPTPGAENPPVNARQAVYDNLARFLGMTYVVACVPQEVLENTRMSKNEVLNSVEKAINISAQDLEKQMYTRKAQNLYTSLLVFKDKIPISDFDKLVYLRQLPGIYFLSEGERIVLESEFRTADFEPVVVWPSISRDDANILDEKRMDLPGVGILPGYVRQYERSDLFAHVLGYTGAFESNTQLEQYNKQANLNAADNPNTTSFDAYAIDDQIGKVGIEASMEEYLRGQKGGRSVRVDAAGNIVDTVEGSERKPSPGHSVYLTIDSSIQEVATKAILDEIENARGQKQASNLTGAAVVLDVQTGEVVALVSVPSYNNNLFRSDRTPDQEKELQKLLLDESNPMYNRAIQGVYAPGSTFKLVTSLAGLNEGVLTPSTSFDCTHYIYVPTSEGGGVIRKTFKCWGQHGSLTVEKAIEQSCDIFFYNAAQDAEKDINGKPLAYYTSKDSTNPIYFRGMGITKLIKYMDMFQLGKPTGIELPGEYPGLLQTPDNYPKYHQGSNWSLGATIVTAIGQGDTQMTPLQICNVTATIANGGTILRPRIVQKVVDADGQVIVPDERVVNGKLQVLQSHLDTIKRGMRRVTQTGGTADRVMANQMGSLAVAGKTGTAEYGEAYGLDSDKNPLFPTLAWFTCFAPYDNPKYAVTTLITTATNQIEGSTFAVPAAKRILQALFPKETGADNQVKKA